MRTHAFPSCACPLCARFHVTSNTSGLTACSSQPWRQPRSRSGPAGGTPLRLRQQTWGLVAVFSWQDVPRGALDAAAARPDAADHGLRDHIRPLLARRSHQKGDAAHNIAFGLSLIVCAAGIVCRSAAPAPLPRRVATSTRHPRRGRRAGLKQRLRGWPGILAGRHRGGLGRSGERRAAMQRHRAAGQPGAPHGAAAKRQPPCAPPARARSPRARAQELLTPPGRARAHADAAGRALCDVQRAHRPPYGAQDHLPRGAAADHAHARRRAAADLGGRLPGGRAVGGAVRRQRRAGADGRHRLHGHPVADGALW